MIKAVYSGTDYNITAKNIVSVGGKSRLKVDTGSPITILSLETLYPELSQKDIQDLRGRILSKYGNNMLNPCPVSASGHQLECILVKTENILLTDKS